MDIGPLVRVVMDTGPLVRVAMDTDPLVKVALDTCLPVKVQCHMWLSSLVIVQHVQGPGFNLQKNELISYFHTETNKTTCHLGCSSGQALM